MYPVLGVVSASGQRSFVLADIPGLIEGAAHGAGLGIPFLKHLARTRLLLHVIDAAPYNDHADPVTDATKIMAEVAAFSEALAQRPRWLVLNKIDLLPADRRAAHCDAIVRALDWQGPVFYVSAATGEGMRGLVDKVMDFLERAPPESLET